MLLHPFYKLIRRWIVVSGQSIEIPPAADLGQLADIVDFGQSTCGLMPQVVEVQVGQHPGQGRFVDIPAFHLVGFSRTLYGARKGLFYRICGGREYLTSDVTRQSLQYLQGAF